MPIGTDTEYQTRIQLNKGPELIKEQKQLEKKMGFSYRQCIGKLIYALTICRIDISIAIITLSQHTLNPVEIHYKTVKNLFIYLNSTKHNGLVYWRTELRLDLPIKPDPVTISKYSTLKKHEQRHNALEVVGLCDTT